MRFLFIYADYIKAVIYDTAPADMSNILTMHFSRKANADNVTASLFEFFLILVYQGDVFYFFI